MDSVQSPLGKFIKERREDLNMSVAAVSKRSKGGISAAYVNKLENDPTVSPSIDKIQALAKGLSVSEQEILKAAGIKALPNQTLDQVYGHFNGFEDLDEKDKEELEPTLVMIANEIRRRLANKRKNK